MPDRACEQMTPEECARHLEAWLYDAECCPQAAAHLRRLGAYQRGVDRIVGVLVECFPREVAAQKKEPCWDAAELAETLLRRLAALEAENERLRERLERAEVVLRALCDDHVRTEMRAHGKSVGDTLAGLAREALKGPGNG